MLTIKAYCALFLHTRALFLRAYYKPFNSCARHVSGIELCQKYLKSLQKQQNARMVVC